MRLDDGKTGKKVGRGSEFEKLSRRGNHLPNYPLDPFRNVRSAPVVERGIRSYKMSKSRTSRGRTRFVPGRYCAVT